MGNLVPNTNCKGYPLIRAAMSKMDQLELASLFQAGQSASIVAEGQTYLVAPEDVEVRMAPRAGFSVAEAGGYLVAVTTELTQSLIQEGFARELVRRIQEIVRKSQFKRQTAPVAKLSPRTVGVDFQYARDWGT